MVVSSFVLVFAFVLAFVFMSTSMSMFAYWARVHFRLCVCARMCAGGAWTVVMWVRARGQWARARCRVCHLQS